MVGEVSQGFEFTVDHYEDLFRRSGVQLDSCQNYEPHPLQNEDGIAIGIQLSTPEQLDFWEKQTHLSVNQIARRIVQDSFQSLHLVHERAENGLCDVTTGAEVEEVTVRFAYQRGNHPGVVPLPLVQVVIFRKEEGERVALFRLPCFRAIMNSSCFNPVNNLLTANK